MLMQLCVMANTPPGPQQMGNASDKLCRKPTDNRRVGRLVQVLFMNMESDIGIVAAFVYAHEQAVKGMLQLVSMIEDGFGDEEEAPASAHTELEVAEKARSTLMCGNGEGGAREAPTVSLPPPLGFLTRSERAAGSVGPGHRQDSVHDWLHVQRRAHSLGQSKLLQAIEEAVRVAGDCGGQAREGRRCAAARLLPAGLPEHCARCEDA